MTSPGERDRIVYVGHATVLIELDGVRLLTDPVLGGWVGPLRRQGPPPAARSRRGDRRGPDLPPPPRPHSTCARCGGWRRDAADRPGGDGGLLRGRGVRGGRSSWAAARPTGRGGSPSPRPPPTIEIGRRGVDADAGRLPGRGQPAHLLRRRHRRLRRDGGARGRGSTSPCCRSGAGARTSGRATWTRSAPPARRRCSRRGSRCRSTGAPSIRAGLARLRPRPLTRAGREFAARARGLAPQVDVEVLTPGSMLRSLTARSCFARRGKTDASLRGDDASVANPPSDLRHRTRRGGAARALAAARRLRARRPRQRPRRCRGWSASSTPWSGRRWRGSPCR